VTALLPPCSVDDVLHRHVAVRFDGVYGRTTVRSWVVDAGVDETGSVTGVEVAAEVGYLFPLTAVTFLDDCEE
jgi:hypothetical protein